MSRIHHYISILVFTAALMLGVQLPNFVDQYVKRIDATQKEITLQHKEYLTIATRHGQGSIDALIKKHEASPDRTFRAEAEPIRKNQARKKRFDLELQALEGSFWSQAMHLLISGDREILRETYNNYSANLPLNTHAAICGLLFGMIASLLLEMFWSLCFRLVRVKPRKRPKKETPKSGPRTEPYIKT